MLAAGYGVLSYVGGEVVGFSSMQMHLLGWLIINQFLLSMLLFLRSNLSGMHHFRMDSVLSVMDKLLLAIILVVLLFGGNYRSDFDIAWFVYAQTASIGVTALLAGAAVLYYSGKIKFKSDWRSIGKMLKETFPYALFGIFMTVYYRLDGVMIERMLPDTGAYQAGVYAACYRLLDAANIIGLLFAGLLLPIFSRMLAKNESTGVLLSFSFRALVGGAFMVAILLQFFATPIVGALYTQSNPYWAQVLKLLFWAFPGVSVVYIYGTVLLAAGKLRIINIITFFTMVLNIGLNLFLIPQWEALGATGATIATQVIASLSMIYFAHRQLAIPFPVLDVARMALLLAGIFLLSLGSTHIGIDWKIKLAALSIIGAALAFLLRVFEWKMLVGLVKNR
jgi:O-antigen/teichoic acid export membrane protein